MGWTFYDADVTTRGKRDNKKIKAILDKQCTWEWDGGSNKPLKSSLVGNTYYAAVEQLLPDGTRKVWAAVTRISLGNENGFRFGYKDMEESMNPFYYDCPIGILNLLTETDSKYANEWRENVRKYHEEQKEKRSKPSLGKLPLGTVIEFTLEGNYPATGTFRAKKILYWKYKRPVWAGSGWRFPTKVIPDNWKVVESV